MPEKHRATTRTGRKILRTSAKSLRHEEGWGINWIIPKELCENDDYYKASGARESLRQGKEPALHLLHRVSLCQEQSSEFYVVSFRHIYSIPKRYVKALIKNKVRKRLLPPYREHLSQSFARYFMRVGLPTNIPKDEIKNYDR